VTAEPWVLVILVFLGTPSAGTGEIRIGFPTWERCNQARETVALRNRERASYSLEVEQCKSDLSLPPHD
jgi:hypothetical protein